MNRPNAIPLEKPLSGGARLLLVLGCGAVMVSFYLFSISSILLLSVFIAGELFLFVVLVRFGASRLMLPYLTGHLGLLTLLLKSFRLRKDAEFRTPLGNEDAPALHEMLRQLCQRLALAFPQEIVLQMGDGAWVQLKGMRTVAGKVTLGVGYDLLAGLTVAEMEAVLAHEMTHAKLINRGFRNWLWAGQARIRILATVLWAEVKAALHAKKSAAMAEFLFSITDRMVRLSTRMVAAYSRQNEFEADRGAAQLCGAQVMRAALSKLNSLHWITSRLPWNERVAQLQQTSGYSHWLLEQIAQGVVPVAANESQGLYSKYSTHPSISDRLAALPGDEKLPASNSPSGIQLLKHPDEIAVKLITELQRLLIEQEKKDSHALEKFLRKAGRHTHLRPRQQLGLLLVIGGTLGAFIGFAFMETAAVLEPFSWMAIAGGVLAIRLGKYNDRLELKVPSFELLMRPAEQRAPPQNVPEVQKAIDAELSQRFAPERNAKRALLLATESYAALEVCDFLRAHVAARQCLKFDRMSVEGALALAVASAAFGQIPSAVQLLTFVQKQTGFKTFSTAWGAAWAGLLTADWVRAEAMLEKALKFQSQPPTLSYLLAIAQSRRGKLQSSILNARRAWEATPESKEKMTFLIARLLDGGYTREAEERLTQAKTLLDSDLELMICRAQFFLLRRNFEEANQWMARIKQADASAQTRVRLAKLYEIARLKDQSASLYQEALALDHYPEAHLGLGRLETEQNNKSQARHHVLAALNVDRPVGKGGLGTWNIFQPILNQMLWLQEPLPDCRAWVAAFPGHGQPAALAGQRFMVYAPDLTQAQQHFQTMLDALQPGKPPVILSSNIWSPAPRPMQPDEPVRPGVQGIWR